MGRGLTEMVGRMPKFDWTQRESVRASLRRNVRRPLAKYGYPPDLAEDATHSCYDKRYSPQRMRSRQEGAI